MNKQLLALNITKRISGVFYRNTPQNVYSFLTTYLYRSKTLKRVSQIPKMGTTTHQQALSYTVRTPQETENSKQLLPL